MRKHFSACTLSQTCDHICPDRQRQPVNNLTHKHTENKAKAGTHTHVCPEPLHIVGSPPLACCPWRRQAVSPSKSRKGRVLSNHFGPRHNINKSNSLSRGQHPPSAQSMSSTGPTLIPARPSSLAQQVISEYFVSTSDTMELPGIFLNVMTHTSQPTGRCERFGR